MGIKIHEYANEAFQINDEDFYDVDYWNGASYESRKISGATLKAELAANIYNSDGTLGADRTVSTDEYVLKIDSAFGDYTSYIETSNDHIELKSSDTSNDIYNNIYIDSSQVLLAFDDSVNNNVYNYLVLNNAITLSYSDVSNTHYLGISAAGVNINGAYSFPSADGTANQILATDGTGSVSFVSFPAELTIAASDETTALTTGTAKVTFRMPYAMTVTEVRASLTTAQTSGSIFTVDINESGTSILSTKLTIDNTEKTSTTASTPVVISDSNLADDAEITIDIDQIGDGTATGLKVTLIGTKA